MPGGCSSLVVVEARSPRFSSVGVSARFEFHLVAFNEPTLCEGKLGTWEVENMQSIWLPKNILQLSNISRCSL